MELEELPSLNATVDSQDFLDLLTQLPPDSPDKKKRVAEEEPPPPKKRKTDPVLHLDDSFEQEENEAPKKVPPRKPSRSSKGPRRRTDRERDRDRDRDRDKERRSGPDRFWHNDRTIYVTPFLDKALLSPKSAINQFCDKKWGGISKAFSPNPFFTWSEGMTAEDVQKKFDTKFVMPNTVFWLPFKLEVCEKILKDIFRLSFSNDFTLIALCPNFSMSTLLPSIFANPQHASVALQNATLFCPIPCVYIFFNCPKGLDIQVENSPSGKFFIENQVLMNFQPLENRSLVAPSKIHKTNFPTEEIEVLLHKAEKFETARQQQNFQCPPFRELAVNNFVRKPFPFDIKSNGPHFYPCPALISFYPKQFLTYPKKKKLLTYKQYNELCEDDSKITGHEIKDSNLMFCSTCGKFGHLPEICWMNVRSTKQLGLTKRQDIVLNKFLLQFPKAFSLRPYSPDDDKIQFISNLQAKLEQRMGYFMKSWDIFARSRKVSLDLVQPGFSQMRQGLAFWYAIACPTYVLQWVTFGVPVFWLFARPPAFEVVAHKRNSKDEDSSPTTIKSIDKFLDLQFILSGVAKVH